MDKLLVPPKIAPYIDALRELIRTGVTAAPSLESSCLVNLKAVQQQAGAHATAAKRAYAFITILQQVVKHRLEGKDAVTARILFGLAEYAGMPLQDRYRAVAKLHSQYWTWENYRKEPLTRHLLAVYLALEREAEAVSLSLSQANGLPRRARDGLVGQDWALERYDAFFTFPAKAGQPLLALQTRQLRATCDQIKVWRHFGYWRERGISGVPQISLFGPGEVAVIDTHIDTATGLRIYIIEVTFPEPIHFGQSVEITLLQRAQAEFNQLTSGWDWYGLVSPANPVQKAKVGVRFPPGKQPRVVWHAKNMINGLVRPGEPISANHLNIDSAGFVSHEWTDLSAGYSYGIALEW